MRRFPPREPPQRRRAKLIHIGAPACFALEMACRQVVEAFDTSEDFGGLYVVGSCLERADWRDIDLRYIMADDRFMREFPGAGPVEHGHWEFDAKWLLLTVAISDRLSKLTGLPVDFQFQPQSHANARHKGRRNAVGLRFAKENHEAD